MKTNITILIILLVLCTFLASCGESPAGNQAIDFTAEDLQGNKIALSDYRGKVVLLDFWATWCVLCLDELPHVKQVYNKYKDSDFEIIGISLDNDPRVLEKFIKEAGITWPQICDGRSWYGKIAFLYRVDALPTTYLIDRDGMIRYVNPMGPNLERSVKELLDAGKDE